MAELKKFTNGLGVTAAMMNGNIAAGLVSALAFGLDGATITSQDNHIQSTFTDESDIDTGSTALWNSAKDGKDPAFCTVFDDCEDSSINTNKWSQNNVVGAATFSESTYGIRVAAAAIGAPNNNHGRLITNGSTALDFKSFSGNSEVIFYYALTCTSDDSNGNAFAKIQLTDGSNFVQLRGVSSSGGAGESSASGYMRVVINKSAQTADVYYDDGSTPDQDNVSLASLSGSNWYLCAEAESHVNTNPGSGSASATIRSIGYADGSAGSSTVIFTDTASTSKDTGIALVTVDNETSTPTITFSANSGTTYGTDDANKVLVEAPTAGTGIRFKVTGAHPTTITATSKNIMTLRGFGAYYG